MCADAIGRVRPGLDLHGAQKILEDKPKGEAAKDPQLKNDYNIAIRILQGEEEADINPTNQCIVIKRTPTRFSKISDL